MLKQKKLTESKQLVKLALCSKDMLKLDDYKKVKELTDLYRALDYYSCQYDRTVREIQSLAANMSPKDIKYAIKESEK